MTFKTLLTSALLLLGLVGCNNGDKDLLGEAPTLPTTVTALMVSPKTSSAPIGFTQTFRADAEMSDGEVRAMTPRHGITWSSSDTSIASVDENGTVTAHQAGTITLTVSGEVSGQPYQDQASFTVTPAIVTALSLTPHTQSVPVGITASFTATATLSDGNQLEVTEQDALTWQSSDNAIASVSAGIVTTHQVGEVTITASGEANGQTFTQSAELTVTDAVVTSLEVIAPTNPTPVGFQAHLRAMATFSDGRVLDVTEQAALTWSSSDDEIALLSESGIATGVSAGTATITASGESNGQRFEDSAPLIISNAVVTALNVSTEQSTLPKGFTTEVQATATLSDGRIIDVTDEPALSWQSSDSVIASVSNQAGSEGMATGINIGTVTLTASGENNGQTFIDSAELEVTPAIITELVIRAERQSIAAGFTTAMTTTATLSDGTTRDVTHEPTLTWLSNEENIASVSQDAIVTGKTSGTVVITAQGDIDGVSFHATESLTITEAIPVSLSVTPQPQASLATPQMPVGWSKAFYAHTTLSDGNVIEVTQEAGLVWQSDNDAIASISNTDKGQAKGESVGQTTLHATLTFDTGSVSGGTIVTITPPHSITFDVRTDAFNNTVAGVRVHYIGYSPTAGYYVTTSGEGYLDSEMASMYLGGREGVTIEEHTFYFGQRSERPISGALTYQASFTWPDGSQTQGILEWQFDGEHYELTDPSVAEHLLTREWDFTLTVSNEMPF